MTHCRDLTLNRLAEDLGVVVGVGGINAVLKSKVWNMDERDLPVLGVYFANEVVRRVAGHHRGRRIVQRTMNLFAVGIAARPAGALNELEEQQGLVMAAVERVVAANPTLARDGVPLLTDLFVAQAGTGFDGESAGVTLALAATSIVAVAHHVEGHPDVTLPMASTR